jgi:protein-tyrosine phosphatase
MALFDFHSHLLYDVDHGVQERVRMIEIFKRYKAAGFGGICLTPHLFHPTVHTKIENIREHYRTAREDARELGLQTYLGSELYVGSQMELQCMPIASRYALVEFSYKLEPMNLKARLMSLKSQGLDIWVAHIERYEWLGLRSKAMADMQSLGCYLQVNAEDYGSKRVKEFLDAEIVDMIVTDNHGKLDAPSLLSRILDKEALVADRMENIAASLCSDDDIA